MIEVAPVEPGWARVTFRLSSTLGDRRIVVVGDFNQWDRSLDEMEQHDDGLARSLRLATGRSYRFRYLIDGERWENDWEADAYVDNEFGGSDSVIDLHHDGPRRKQLATESTARRETWRTPRRGHENSRQRVHVSDDDGISDHARRSQYRSIGS